MAAPVTHRAQPHICDFHIGYAPDLKEILINKIDKLLNERQ